MAVPAAGGAQTLLVTPPEKMMVSPGGVDMRSGRYAYSQTDLAIGGEAGLALTRTLSQQVVGHTNPFADFSHNFDLMLVMKSVHIQTGDLGDGAGNPDTQVEIAFGGLSQTFQSAGLATGYDLISRAGYARLTYSAPDGKRENPAAIYTFQTGDGTSASFRPVGSADCSATVRCAFVSQLTHADGTLLNFEYESGGAGATRLRAVTSSRGYALILEYSGTYVSRACVLNLAIAPKPASNSCPAGATTATYGYDTLGGETRLASATDPTGAIWRFVNAARSIGFVKPGQSAPWLTNSFTRIQANDDGLMADIVDGQSFADGQSYTYGFTYSPYVPNHVATIAGGGYFDAKNHGTSVEYQFPAKPGTGPGEPCLHIPCTQANLNSDGTDSTVYQMPSGPSSVTDALGRVTSYDYCDPQAMANLPSTYHNRCYVMPAMVSSTEPSGIKTYYTWDYSTHNLLGTRQVAVPGSPLADIVRSATYNCTPATLRSCAKPVSVTDARRDTSTYSYAAEHGGILTETSPAVGGIQAQKRYTYQQRTAWVANGTGGYVAAGPPIWVLAQVSICKAGNPAASGTGCANGAADEVVTAYEYGPDGGPNNLLLRGVVVDPGGLNLRTCYAYDAAGNRISETRPRAGLASCP